MTVASAANKVTLNGNGATTSWPFSFRIFDSSDLEIYKTDTAGVQTEITSNFSVVVNGESGGTVTYPSTGSPLASGETITIIRVTVRAQSVDFTSQGAFLPQNHEDADDRAMMILQELDEKIDRAFKLPTSDTSGTATELTTDVTGSAGGVLYIQAGVLKLSDSANIDDLETLAGISGDITTVAANDANITTVANNINGTDTIGTVAGSIANVNNVGNNISNVLAVDSNSANINAAVANATNINTVAGISANVTTVAGISADVTAVAADAADIGVVSSNIADVNTVAGISANVTTVATDTAAINTVATDLTGVDDIGTVATNISNVNAVGSNISDITNAVSQAAAGVQRNTHTGDSSTVTFTLPATPWVADVVFAYLDGVNQDNSEWSVSGSDITFNTAPGTGVNIELVVLTAGTVTAAQTNASNAAVSAASAAASLASFQSVYLGAQSSDPSVDLNGDPLTTGDWYFNAASGKVRIYNSPSWGDALAGATTAGNETITGDWDFRGDVSIQSKFIVVESPGAGVDSITALHAARDAVGVGGTIMLAPGQDYEIASDIQMNVEGQTLIIPAGASITSQTPATGDSIDVEADNCTVMGEGALNYVAVVVGNYSVVGSGTGFRLLGNLVFKDPLTRAVNVVDVFGDDPIIIEGARVYWTTAGVANSKTGLPLVINVETDDTTSNGENVIIRDCEVDYSAWTLEDVAEVSYPSSGAPNTIGIRVRANNESTFTRWRVEGCTVIMPTATAQSAWDPVTYGNVADAAGGRRPTCFEITAIRSTLTYSSKSAGFTAAETVTGGTSGATCVVGSDDTTTMQVYSISGQFEQGETITGGTSGSTATFESLQGNSREGVFLNNRAIGGDLGFSFGGVDTLAYSGNRAEYQTSYPLEFAGGQVISGAGNYFDGRYAGKAVSCTNTKVVSLPGSYVVPGANTAFSTTNTGVTLEGVGRLNMSGSTFKAGADSISLIRIRPGGGAQSEINLTGCTFLGDGYSTLKAVHVDQGTVSAMILNGCVFRDIDTNSLIVDSGTTITNLITTGNVGVSAGAFTNNGTVTNHIDNNNLGITGLTGASAYDESNVAITGGTIDGITGTNLDINSGNIDGTAIGSSSRSTGYFSEIGIGTSGPAFGDFELVSSGNAQMKIHSNFSGSTTSGLYIDTSGDTSDGKVIFQKDGVSRGVFTYSHAASGGSEYFGINVAGGTDKLTVEGSGHVGLNNNAPAYACDAGGDANVTGVYRVSGTQVVGAQGATISDPTGGSTVDTEARTAINALIDRLQAHGLIA